MINSIKTTHMSNLIHNITTIYYDKRNTVRFMLIPGHSFIDDSEKAVHMQKQ